MDEKMHKDESDKDRPSALQPLKAQAPVVPKNVARIKVSRVGNNADFKGKTYTSEGETWTGSAEDLAVLDADPYFVVERFDKDGHLLKRTGEPYKGVPAAKPIRKHKEDEG